LPKTSTGNKQTKVRKFCCYLKISKTKPVDNHNEICVHMGKVKPSYECLLGLSVLSHLSKP